jgi:predicted nuclease of restriction endonuclease-like (RecB) superfamily
MESILHGLQFLNDEQVQDPYKLEFLSLVKKYQERLSNNQQ